MARPNEKPTDPAERIAEAARAAYEDAGGDMREAARRLEGNVRRSRALRDELTDPLISAACWDAIRQQCRSNRSRIWHTPVSVAPSRPQLPAQTSAPKADAARVIQLAAGNLMLFPLPGGRPLGQATRQEIAAAAEFYATQAADMGVKARWLALVAEAVPEGRQAGQVLNETRLRELRGLADA
ncbi:hypothetical protein ACQVP2_29525 [Methylobacterium aquaticum]|uniref:hypothetical protein n=1 Tax=Methylobacterium aquaticum TaxID=270351 RepID=UPI003D17E34E